MLIDPGRRVVRTSIDLASRSRYDRDSAVQSESRVRLDQTEPALGEPPGVESTPGSRSLSPAVGVKLGFSARRSRPDYLITVELTSDFV